MWVATAATILQHFQRGRTDSLCVFPKCVQSRMLNNEATCICLWLLRHRETRPYPNLKNKQRRQQRRQCIEISARKISLIYITYLFHSTFSLLTIYLIFLLPSVLSHPKFPQQQFCKYSFPSLYFPLKNYTPIIIYLKETAL